jgi:trigger factor
MELTREDLNPCTVRVAVKASPDQVKDAFDRALKQISKKISLPGFRKGHAPRAMLENLVNKEELYDEAANILVRTSYKKILEQESIEADRATRPTVNFEKLDKEKSEAEFEFKIPLPPQITLGEYKGLKLELPKIDVTEEEVDRQIEEFRRRRQTREAVTDRGVETGDIAVVNIKVDGEESEGRNFMTIAGQTFPELDQALQGMGVEDLKSVELPFPANFQEADWAGKTLKAVVTLNSLSSVRLPELDDEFAQSMQTESVDDLRARVQRGLERAKEQMLRNYASEQLLERLTEASEVHVSDNMWEELAMRRLMETAEEQKRQGKTLEQFAQENGMSVEQYTEAWRNRAKIEVQHALIIREVFVAEKMNLTNEELNQELFAMAEEANLQIEEMVEVLKKNEALDEVQFRAISRKVSSFLEEHAQVTEVEAPAAAAQ